MKKILSILLIAIAFVLSSCDDSSSSSSNGYYNNSSSSGGYNPSFQGAGVSRTVSLRSYSGGRTFGYGTFYEGRMEVVVGQAVWKVRKYNSNGWNYVVEFTDGTAYYFN